MAIPVLTFAIVWRAVPWLARLFAVCLARAALLVIGVAVVGDVLLIAGAVAAGRRVLVVSRLLRRHVFPSNQHAERTCGLVAGLRQMPPARRLQKVAAGGADCPRIRSRPTRNSGAAKVISRGCITEEKE
jgi:hypothetical protein